MSTLSIFLCRPGRFFYSFLLTFGLLSATAQTALYQLNTVPLNNLEAFREAPDNWGISGPLQSSFTDTAFNSAAGTGVLLNHLNPAMRYKPNRNLFTAFDHGDIYLELDFMMPRGSNSGIYLQSRYEIQLFDSWGVKFPKSDDCGAIYQRWDENLPEGKKGYEGHAPLKNAALAPGLWQHLEILFRAPRFDAAGNKIQSAQFIKVVLNGIVIHENIILSGPTRAAAFADEKPKGPLMIQGDHGMVAFRNIRYAPLEDLSIPVSDLTYEYYEGDFENLAQVNSKQLVRKGNAEAVDVRLADAKDNFYIRFSGKISVPVTATYHAVMRLSGIGKLEIDGKEIIPATWTWTGGDILQGDVDLSAGEHRFVLHCLKHVGWAPPGLGLFMRKPNSKLTALHTPSSLPEPTPEPLVQLKTGQEPELLRSFLMYKGVKLTHAISVGDPAGVNYSYNLKQGGLLQVWKNDFLNTTDMWFERGEPQIAAPMGPAIIMSGHFPLASSKDMLPDSLIPGKELLYKGYQLDEKRYPVFIYAFGKQGVRDRFLPYDKGRGLMRIINIQPAADPGAVFRIAEGKQITELQNGLYAIDDQSYYLQLLPLNGQIPKPFVIDRAGHKELLLNASINELQYVLYW